MVINKTNGSNGSNGNINHKYIGLLPKVLLKMGYVLLIIISWYFIGIITLGLIFIIGLIRIFLTATPGREKLKSSIKLLLTLSAIYLLIYFLGGYGLIGFFILIIILAGFKIWMSRDIFMGGIRDIERIIWGSPAEERIKWLKKKKE